jgi:hypothetical protein
MGRQGQREAIGATTHPRDLAAHATIRIADPIRCTVTCLTGLLWLTHDGDPKDLILKPGEQYRADRRSMLLVHALEESRLELMSVD